MPHLGLHRLDLLVRLLPIKCAYPDAFVEVDDVDLESVVLVLELRVFLFESLEVLVSSRVRL